jgi:hypothetical protein
VPGDISSRLTVSTEWVMQCFFNQMLTSSIRDTLLCKSNILERRRRETDSHFSLGNYKDLNSEGNKMRQTGCFTVDDILIYIMYQDIYST